MLTRKRDFRVPSTRGDESSHDTGSRELTHFSTAATYDKAPGTPARINQLCLWRVHYPVDKVLGGGCVFSEFEGYFAIDFTPAIAPGRRRT